MIDSLLDSKLLESVFQTYFSPRSSEPFLEWLLKPSLNWSSFQQINPVRNINQGLVFPLPFIYCWIWIVLFHEKYCYNFIHIIFTYTFFIHIIVVIVKTWIKIMYFPIPVLSYLESNAFFVPVESHVVLDWGIHHLDIFHSPQTLTLLMWIQTWKCSYKFRDMAFLGGFLGWEGEPFFLENQGFFFFLLPMMVLDGFSASLKDVYSL